MTTDTDEAAAAAAAASPLRVAMTEWQAYRAANAHLFPSEESWRWFVRTWRAELLAHGALCTVAGRQFVRPQEMERAIVEIGTRAAAPRRAA